MSRPRMPWLRGAAWGLLVSAGLAAGAPAGAYGQEREDPPDREPGERADHPAHSWRLGVFVGGLVTPPNHDLHNPGFTGVDYRAALTTGARLGYMPLPYLGVEGEFMHGEGSVTERRGAATFHAYRAHLFAQYPVGALRPFVLAGAGRLGATSAAMGSDTQTAVHVGLGASFDIDPRLALRADLRGNVQRGRRDSLALNPELSLGLAFSWDGPAEQQPPVHDAPVAPVADGDGDGVPDADDRCPARAALEPDGCPADRDGDGVPDADDRCPFDAGDAKTGCPAPDPDGDGVPSACDACPDQAGDGPDGCMRSDTDADGIPDASDQCPDKPETHNGFNDRDGCPDSLPDELAGLEGVVDGLHFEFDQGSVRLHARSHAPLDGVAAVLNAHPGVRLRISGHSSSEGDAANNERLSAARAEAVKAYLVGREVDADRIETRGVGASEPLAPERTEADREKDRRIEFQLLPPSK